MSIDLHGISKSFAGQPVLRDISLSIPGGQMLALLGASGSGKTTLLRIIAGLEYQDRGQIHFHGRDISHLPARDRKAGFVFQHYALFRHMTVFDNVAFGLSVQPRRVRPSRQLIAQKVNQLLAKVQLSAFSQRFPAQLSGGQKQRVALARALAVEPPVLLLDEPFGALDAQVRKELRYWLRQLHRELAFTCIFVTHDQQEALEVADQVVVMHQGQIEQSASPQTLWQQPASRFVLEFLGDVNQLSGQISGDECRIAQYRWSQGYIPADQGEVDLLLRPWEVDIHSTASPVTPLPVQVLDSSPRGHYQQLIVQPVDWWPAPLTVSYSADSVPNSGEIWFVGLKRGRIYPTAKRES